jgi:hypothetical protein
MVEDKDEIEVAKSNKNEGKRRSSSKLTNLLCLLPLVSDHVNVYNTWSLNTNGAFQLASNKEKSDTLTRYFTERVTP